MVTVGLDLSLTKTGICIMAKDGKVLFSGVINSKPAGDKPVDETRRILKIAEDVMEKIDDILPGEDPAIVAIEGLAFMAKGTSLVQLSGLNYLIRILLNNFTWPFVIVAPSTLKKFATGSGKGDKDMVVMAVYKNFGFESMGNNEADAYVLAAIGQAVLGNYSKKITVPQSEVVKLIKTQL